jgi:hypothetical protein
MVGWDHLEEREGMWAGAQEGRERGPRGRRKGMGPAKNE